MSVPSAPRTRKRWYLYGAVILIVGASVWYLAARSGPKKQRYPQPAWAGTGQPPLVPVRTVEAQTRDLAVHLKAIGTVTALNTVVVKSRVDGQLLRVAFDEGGRVTKGQVLAEIDPASYRIALAEAEGQQRQAAAQAQAARSDLERIQKLHSNNLVTNQELEVQRALVAQREGALVTAQARVDDAQLELDYTRIVAPIAGRAGMRAVDAGNLIKTGDADGIVTLTQTQPIAVVFTIPEGDVPRVLEPFRAGEKLAVEAWDRTETRLLAAGFLATIDNQIDIATGTLRLRAEFANADDQLFPNQFVNVRLRVRTLERAVVIPSAAVQFGARGTYVFVIDAQNKAAIRDVVLGPVEAGQQAVTEGLEAGALVVLEGLDRLREGSGVVLANENPTAAPAPTSATTPNTPATPPAK